MSDRTDLGRPGRRIAANAAWLMAADLVGKLSNFVLVVILARGLGPRQYGYFAFALAFVPLFLHLARWGIDITSLRRIAMRPEEFSKVFVNGVVLRVTLAVAATGVAIALLPLFVEESDAFKVVLVLALALLLDEVATYETTAFTAFEQMRFEAVILITNRLASTALAGVVVAAGGGLLSICLAYLLGSLGAFVLGSLLLVRRLPPLHRADLDRAEVRTLLRQGAPYGIANFLNMAVFRIDTVLLEVLKGPVAVGLYGVAYRFFEPLLFVTWSISQAATPRMVRDAEAKGDSRTFELSMAAMLAFYLPIAAGTPFVAGWVLELLFGTRYSVAETAVVWLAASAVPYSVAHLARMAAIAAGQTRSITVVAGTVLVLNVVLNLVLIPDHGVSGAAAATFVTEVADCILLLALYVRRVAPIRLSGAVAAPMLATACMAAVLATGVHDAGALLVAPLVYGATLAAATRLVAPGDMRALVHAVRPGPRTPL